MIRRNLKKVGIYSLFAALFLCGVGTKPVWATVEDDCLPRFKSYCDYIAKKLYEESVDVDPGLVSSYSHLLYLLALERQGVKAVDTLVKLGNLLSNPGDPHPVLVASAIAINPDINLINSSPTLKSWMMRAMEEVGEEKFLSWVREFNSQFFKMPSEVRQEIGELAQSDSRLGLENNLLNRAAMLMGQMFNSPSTVIPLEKILSQADIPQVFFRRENLLDPQTLDPQVLIPPLSKEVKEQLKVIVEQNPSLKDNLYSLVYSSLGSSLSVNKFSGLVPVVVDVAYASDRERYAYGTVSGGTVNDVFEPVSCFQRLCRQIELYPVQGMSAVFPQGRFVAWIDKEQKVKGGKGVLVGNEPTGQKPFPPSFPFKIVLERIDERNGVAHFALYKQKRFKFKATPHVFGPIPIPNSPGLIVRGQVREGEIIYVSPKLAQSPTLASEYSGQPAPQSVQQASQVSKPALQPNQQASPPKPLPQQPKPTPQSTPQSGQQASRPTPPVSKPLPQPSQQSTPQSKPVPQPNQQAFLPASSGKLRFTNPLPGYPITSAFGWRIHPVHGDRRFHKGIDIGAPQGTPIIAAADGCVTTASAGHNGGYGNLVVLSHGQGSYTKYAHLSRINVRLGECVRKGTVIGSVGSTGLSTGPHLHFEVIVNNQLQDPRAFI